MKSLLSVFVLLSAMVFGTLRADISGPNGVPDFRVDLYDLAVFAEEWLESENYMSLGDELAVGFPNGSFIAQEGWSVSGSSAVWFETNSSQNGNAFYLPFIAEIGKTYRVTFEVYDSAVYNFYVFGYISENDAGTQRTGDGIYTQDILATLDGDSLGFKTGNCSVNSTFKIRNFSVREVLPDGGMVTEGGTDGIWPWK
jgi:hypothetical protein